MTETADKASYIKGLAWLLLGTGVAVVLAFGIAPFVRAVPFGWERSLAQVIQPVPPADVCAGTFQQRALLKKLMGRLYPLDKNDSRFSFDVHILNSAQVNAFAELGGEIFIDKGLLQKARSPEEVAGVLAHEMSHVSRRHILEGFLVRVMTFQGLQLIFGPSVSNAQWAALFMNMGFTRSQEAEADRGALERLQKAHIDNRGFEAFFERMARSGSMPEFLSDHPSNESRLEMIKEFPNGYTRPVMSDEEWKVFKAYCR